jgi:hypothetical protein
MRALVEFIISAGVDKSFSQGLWQAVDMRMIA